MRHLKKIEENFEDIYEPNFTPDVPEKPKKDVYKKDFSEKQNLNKILRRMFGVSNNSVVTNKTAIAIARNLDPAEIREFEKWLGIIESEMLILKNQSKNRRW